MLLLPHHLEYKETLANLPFFYEEMARNTCEVVHLIQSNPNFLPEMATASRLQEYLLGGEADENVEYIDGYADDFEEDNNLLEWELADEWIGSI